MLTSVLTINKKYKKCLQTLKKKHIYNWQNTNWKEIFKNWVAKRPKTISVPTSKKGQINAWRAWQVRIMCPISLKVRIHSLFAHKLKLNLAKFDGCRKEVWQAWKQNSHGGWFRSGRIGCFKREWSIVYFLILKHKTNIPSSACMCSSFWVNFVERY